jgi:hypothetical protein
MRFSTRTFLFSSVPNIALLISAFFFIENLTVSALTNDAKRSLRQTQLRMAHSRARSEEESARLLKIVSENAPLKAAMQLMGVSPTFALRRLFPPHSNYIWFACNNSLPKTP